MLSHFSHAWLFATSWTISPPGFSIHGILQARILEWVAIPSSRGVFQTQGLKPHLLHHRQILYCRATRKDSGVQVMVLKVQEAKVALVSFSNQFLRRSSMSQKEPGPQILKFDLLGFPYARPMISWFFLHFTLPVNEESIVSQSALKSWTSWIVPGSQRPPALPDPVPLAAGSRGEEADRDPTKRSWAG